MKTCLIPALVFCAAYTFGQNELPTINLFQDTVYMTDTLLAGESYRLEWDRLETNVSRVVTALGCTLIKVDSPPNLDVYICRPFANASQVVISSKRVKGKTEIKDSYVVFQIRQL